MLRLVTESLYNIPYYVPYMATDSTKRSQSLFISPLFVHLQFLLFLPKETEFYIFMTAVSP